MKRSSLTILLFSLICLTARTQQLWRYDNTNYKAIYFKAACDLIAKTPDLVLLDVRSPGEYADTSQFITSRIGRLKAPPSNAFRSTPYNNITMTCWPIRTGPSWFIAHIASAAEGSANCWPIAALPTSTA